MYIGKGLLFIFLVMAVSGLHADTIYKWTDADGVRRFSNQPPSGVTDYEIVQGETEASNEGQREGYERMMQEVEQQNRLDEALARQKAFEREAEAKHRAETERRSRVQAERQRLQQRIDALMKRALGPTFTEGMRQAQVKEIQDEINALEGPENPSSSPGN